MRITLRLLLWPVGVALFAAAAEPIQRYLDFAEGESYSIWVMLFGMAAAPALATALAEMASERFKLNIVQILVLVNLATWALPLAFTLMGLYLTPEDALPAVWSAGFLLGGAAWVVVIEQAAHCIKPDKPERKEILTHPKVRRMLKRIAAGVISGTGMRWLSGKISERSNEEKAAGLTTTLAALIAVGVVEWLRYFSVISGPDLWLTAAVAVAAGLPPTLAALFWSSIWCFIWRLPGRLQARIRRLLRRSDG